MAQHFIERFEDARDRRYREPFQGRGTRALARAGAVSVCFELMELQVLEGWLGMADDRWKCEANR